MAIQAAAAAATAAAVAAAQEAVRLCPAMTPAAETFATLPEALGALYSPSSPEGQRRAADDWLQKAGRSAAGWGLAWGILGGHCPMADAALHEQAQFYGARTLYTKLCEDFDQIGDAAAKAAVRTAVLNHLAARGLSQAPGNIIKKLCLAATVATIQTDWPGVFPFIEQLVGTAGADPASLRAAATVALELLAAMPEQCHSYRVYCSEDVKEAALTRLRGAATGALGFLKQISDREAARGAAADQVVLTLVYRALREWVAHVDMPAALVAADPLFLSAFDVVGASITAEVTTGLPLDHGEAAAEVVVAGLQAYRRLAPENMPMVQAIVPRVMTLRPLYQQAVAAGEDGEDAAFELARVFTEMGEAYIELIVGAQELEQVSMVDLVLMCTANPTRRVAMLTLPFYYRLIKAWSGVADPALKQRRQQMLGPAIASLTQHCVRLLRYPDDVEALSGEEADDVRRQRVEVSDSVEIDCVKILGAEHVLQLLWGLLGPELARAAATGQESGVGGWGAVEACLFAVRTIYRDVPRDEGTVLPLVMQALAQLPPWPRLRVTACYLVGNFSSWLATHPQCVQPMFQFLLQHVGMPECTTAAASSINSVCKACAPHMGEPVLSLYDGLVSARGTMRLKDETNILAGLCYVISSLPAEAAVKWTHRVVAPVVESLGAALQAPQADPDAVCSDLQRLTAIIQSLKFNDAAVSPVAELVKALWPTLTAVAARFSANAHVVEKLSRVYKHSMRGCGAAFAPLVQQMAEHLVGAFSAAGPAAGVTGNAVDKTAQAAVPYLYAASILVGEFGTFGASRRKMAADPATAAGLDNVVSTLLTSLSNAVFAHLTSPERFTAMPDTVEEFFFLAQRGVTFAPSPLLESPLLASIFQCGLAGMHVEHREARQGILAFFEEVVGAAVEDGAKDETERQRKAARRPAVEALLAPPQTGPTLVTLIVRALVGDLPSTAVDEGHGTLAGVLWKLNRFAREMLRAWLATSLQTIDVGVVPDQERSDFMVELFKDEPGCAPGSKASQDRFFFVVVTFAGRARWQRNKIMREKSGLV